MDSQPRSSSWVLPATLVGIIIALIAAGLLYSRTQAPETPAPAPMASPLTEPSPDPSASPSPDALPLSADLAPADPNAQPDLTVDAQGLSKAVVTVNTTQGVIKFRFYPNEAPTTVRRIIELVKAGFYNNLTFHRVVPGFVVQGGDPSGNGTGGSGQKLKAEFNSRKHVEGAVAMARASDPDSADSQFYISLGTHSHLDGQYTVFGQVVEGMDVVRKLKVGDRMNSVTVQ